jgi:hypothetical protein
VIPYSCEAVLARRLLHVRGGYIDSTAAPQLMLSCDVVFCPSTVIDVKHGKKGRSSHSAIGLIGRNTMSFRLPLGENGRIVIIFYADNLATLITTGIV